jgi:lipopolysaccharide export system protein LptC
MPATIGVLAAALIFAPLSMRGDVSFVLDKNKVAMAKERMRVSAATYRGEDDKGEAFTLKAGSAVQTSSRDPVVRMQDLSAEIALKEGPATLTANSGRYDMDRDIVNVDGPIVFASADGYRLQTRDVAVGLKSKKMASGGPVSGQMPIGNFSANRLTADLAAHSVTLEGGARLHIVQGRAR